MTPLMFLDAKNVMVCGLLGATLWMAGCASQPSTPAPGAPPASLPPPPAGSQRLPGSLTCETEISCSACSDDKDKELVRMAFLVHSAEIRSCYERSAANHPGTEGRVVFRIGIDPTGLVGTSCVVRTSLNDATVDQCLMDVVLKWKFPAPASGNWALVDYPYVFTRR
jgi:TonB family protein